MITVVKCLARLKARLQILNPNHSNEDAEENSFSKNEDHLLVSWTEQTELVSFKVHGSEAAFSSGGWTIEGRQFPFLTSVYLLIFVHFG